MKTPLNIELLKNQYNKSAIVRRISFPIVLTKDFKQWAARQLVGVVHSIIASYYAKQKKGFKTRLLLSCLLASLEIMPTGQPENTRPFHFYRTAAQKSHQTYRKLRVKKATVEKAAKKEVENGLPCVRIRTLPKNTICMRIQTEHPSSCTKCFISPDITICCVPSF